MKKSKALARPAAVEHVALGTYGAISTLQSEEDSRLVEGSEEDHTEDIYEIYECGRCIIQPTTKGLVIFCTGIAVAIVIVFFADALAPFHGECLHDTTAR